MVMIAADGMRRLLADPFDARRRLEAVIDQITQHQADVERLGDSIQGRPIGVDIGQQKNAHE